MEGNVYEAPQADISKSAEANTSGMGKGHPLPEGVAGWGWGAFCWNWIWSIGNGTYIGLLALVPYVGFIMAIVLGVKGREWAWQNKKWDSVEHFDKVQKKWAYAYLILLGISLAFMLIAIVIGAIAGGSQ